MGSWGTLKKTWPAGQGRRSSPSTLPSEATSGGVLCAVLGSSVQETQNHWRESSRGPQRWFQAWSISLMREGWETWDCLAWKRANWDGILSTLRNIWRVWVKWVGLGSLQRWPAEGAPPKGQCAQTGIQEVPNECEKIIYLLWWWHSPGTSCPGSSLLLYLHIPVQYTLGTLF